LVISRNTADGPEVTHFKITGITNGTLFQNDGVTPIADGQFIMFAQGNAGLRFTPALHFHGSATFQVQASLGNSDAGVGGGVVAATIDVGAVAHTPSVTDAETNEDTQSAGGLVISRNAIDGPEVTSFKITNITNGTLYQNDGTTQIHDGDFITFAQGNAGLKFSPAADFFGTGSFEVQASTSADDSGLGGSAVTANITVESVDDAPTIDPIGDIQIDEDAPQQLIGLTGITVGPANEVFTGQTIASVAATSDNHSLTSDPVVTFDSGTGTYRVSFTPLANANGTAHITVTVQDDGGTDRGGVDTFTRTFTLTVNPEPDAPILDTFPITALPAVLPRTVPNGVTISQLAQRVTDYDAGDPKGIAIVGFNNIVNKRTVGVWQYSVDGGTTWMNVATVSQTNALLLGDDPLSRVRFLPNKGFKGFVDISYRAWDQSDGKTPLMTSDSSVAGNTAYSTSIERAWVEYGDSKPKVDASGNTIIRSVLEDARNPRTVLVKSIIGLAANEQAVSKGLGIALINASTPDGHWQFRLVGTKAWQDVPAGVSTTNALLLRPTDSLRFVPNLHFHGTEVIEFRTWDAKTGTAGQLTNPTGPAFSVNGGSASLTIVHVNHAPVLTLPTSPSTLNPAAANQTTNAITLGSIMSANDVDGDTIGVSITGAAGSGTWEYSTDGGATWQILKASGSKPLRMAADTMVRFTASASARKSTATLSFKAWDETVDSRGRPLSTSASKVTEKLTVAVN
jgi:hypothetical protein